MFFNIKLFGNPSLFFIIFVFYNHYQLFTNVNILVKFVT